MCLVSLNETRRSPDRDRVAPVTRQRALVCVCAFGGLGVLIRPPLTEEKGLRSPPWPTPEPVTAEAGGGRDLKGLSKTQLSCTRSFYIKITYQIKVRKIF